MALYGETQCKGHYKDVAQYCKYCDEIYVIQLFVREDFKMHLYRNLICFGNTIYSGGNIDILYLAIKMKLTEKKKIRENVQIQQGVE